jgi:hypothetical protein
MDVVPDILQAYERAKLREGVKFYDNQWLEEARELFRTRFGPDKLQALDGVELLETLFGHSTRSSLVYWLEF